jgi:hypothetical protein
MILRRDTRPYPFALEEIGKVGGKKIPCLAVLDLNAIVPGSDTSFWVCVETVFPEYVPDRASADPADS